MKKIIRLSVLGLFLAGLGFGSLAQANTNRFSFIYTPSTGDNDWFHTLGSTSLNQFGWRIGTVLDYGYEVGELQNGGTRTQGLVDNLFVQHFHGALGLTDWWEVEVNVPVVWWNEFYDPAVVSPAAENVTSMGDIVFRTKLSLLDRNEKPIGLALVPFITVPTGRESRFMGNSEVTGGALAVVDANLGSRVSLGLNVGAEFRERVQFFDLDTASRLLWGLGLGVNVSDNFTVKGDLFGATPIDDIFDGEANNPVEVLAGVDYAFGDSGWRVNAAGGTNIVDGAGAPNFRGTFGISFTSNPERVRPAPKPHVPFWRQQTVYFDFNSSQLTGDARSTLDRVINKLHEFPKSKVVLAVGHADAIGSDNYNRRLSLSRANRVKSYFLAKGIPQVRVQIEGRGENAPKATNDTEEGRRLNRRVEIRVID